MPEVSLKVALLRHTLSPEETVALGARLCYSRAGIDDLTRRVSQKDQSEFVQKQLHHESQHLCVCNRPHLLKFHRKLLLQLGFCRQYHLRGCFAKHRLAHQVHFLFE